MTHFKDRYHAGSLLAKTLRRYEGLPETLVLGIPRGGIPVAYEIAKSLGLPLDVFMVRKLGVPGHEELAMGAISSGGGQILNVAVVDALGIPRERIEQVANRELQTLQLREALYRKDRGELRLEHKQVILVDDGLATGSTMLAGIQALKHLNPKRIIVAVPVSPVEACAHIRQEVDEWHCLSVPEPFYSVGQWYEDFSQVDDSVVRKLLEERELDMGVRHHSDQAPWGERRASL